MQGKWKSPSRAKFMKNSKNNPVSFNISATFQESRTPLRVKNPPAPSGGMNEALLQPYLKGEFHVQKIAAASCQCITGIQ